MSMMSDMDILADKVHKRVDDGVEMMDAIEDVAEASSYDEDDVAWAYKNKYVGEL